MMIAVETEAEIAEIEIEDHVVDKKLSPSPNALLSIFILQSHIKN